MKHNFFNIAIYSTLILGSSLSISTDVLANPDSKPATSATAPGADKKAAVSKHKMLAEKSQQVVTEARDAVTGTQQALMALEKNDAKSALTVLQDVSKKLDTLLAKNPTMTLVTADIEADIIDFNGDNKTVAQEIKRADKLLDSGKLQGARQILSSLASEMEITTVSVPLGTYPAAIKTAIDQINAGKTEDAALTLDNVLSTLVENVEVIPLPILRAEALLTIASELEHRDDLSKEQSRTEVLKYADAAKEKLKLAELLGYGGKNDYKQLYAAIDGIKTVIHSEKSETIWSSIKQSLSNLRDRIKAVK